VADTKVRFGREALPGLRTATGVGVVLGVAGLGAWFAAYNQDQQLAWGSYLFGFVLWSVVSLGCLALVILQNLTKGRWGHALVRFWEAGALMLPYLLVVALPMFLVGYKYVYPWADPEKVAADHALQAKQFVMTPGFTLARVVFVFVVWMTILLVLRSLSRKQDETGNAMLARKRVNVAGPSAVFFVLTVTLAATDWVMSLEPHWYSTIFGLLFTVGAALTAMSLGTAYLATVREREPYNDALYDRQWRDLGNLLLTLTILWAYMSFSQFLIIWSGNLPEEIGYYVKRQEGIWSNVGAVLVFLHFLVPFFIFLSSLVKTRPQMLRFAALYLLAVHFVDVMWMVLPSLGREGGAVHWADFAAAAGIGGLWIAGMATALAKTPLVPNFDPHADQLEGTEVAEHA
jgi:hypothetical protein